MIVGRLNALLGEYFVGIDTSQIETSLYGGTLELRDLEAKPDALDNLGGPLIAIDSDGLS